MTKWRLLLLICAVAVALAAAALLVRSHRGAGLPTALIDDMHFKDFNLKVKDVQSVPDPRSVPGNYRVQYRFTVTGIGKHGLFEYRISYYDRKGNFLGMDSGKFRHHESPDRSYSGELHLRVWQAGETEFEIVHWPTL